MKSITNKSNLVSGKKDSPNESKRKFRGGDAPSHSFGEFCLSEWDNTKRYTRFPPINGLRKVIWTRDNNPLSETFGEKTLVGFKDHSSYRDTAEQLQIFPEAKSYLAQQSRTAQRTLKKVQLIKYIVEKKSQHKQFWFDIVDGLYKEPAEKIINRNLLALSKNHTKLNLARAKQFPITDLLQFRHRTTKCIFHTDKTPSLYYYPQSNTVFCFSCNQYADSIAVYQKLNNCSFVEAVKALS